ncbi:hypothetical protein [Pseudomonas cichorii]|uniref:hypothetical protein n=1 Tax=Pseudomonas cichorii TaxID=36746 RepID=UPI0027DEEEEB|nr:hypothetical protein [Pseudomonas cichorii]
MRQSGGTKTRAEGNGFFIIGSSFLNLPSKTFPPHAMNFLFDAIDRPPQDVM